MPKINYTQEFIRLAKDPYRLRCEETLAQCAGDWAKLQQCFLDMVDAYLAAETEKEIGLNIGAHEAGGQFRIAFPHFWFAAMKKPFIIWKKW